MTQKNPRPHQKKALADIRAGLKSHDRGKVIMATGTGKTLVAWWSLVEHADGPSVAFVPSLALARQLYNDWRAKDVWKNGRSHRWLVVCSDPSVAGDDHDDASVDDLKQEIGSVTNNPAEIHSFLSAAPERSVVICTYQSAPILASGMPAGFSFTIGVFDEAHKTAGRAGRLFSHALGDENVSIRKRLFFTATPRRSAYKPRPGEKAELFHMDDPAAYGPVFHELPFRRAVDQGLVADYDVLLSVIQRPDLKRSDILADKTQALLAKTLVVTKAAEEHGIRKVFSFHETNNAAEMARQMYAAHAKGFAFYRVNGAQSALERDNILARFADDDRAIVTNARCLGEGVNVPACDSVAFLTPKRSKVDVIQAVGRACRMNGAGKRAKIILPIFLHPGETLEEAKRRSAFGDALETLAALKEYDKALADDLRRMRDTLVQPEARFAPSVDETRIKIVVDGAGREGVAGMALEQFRRAFGVSVASEFSDGPEDRCASILEAARVAATTSPPRPPTSEEYFWIYRYASNKTATYRPNFEAALRQILPAWLPRAKADRTAEKWALLEEFFRLHRHNPSGYRSESESVLSDFITRRARVEPERLAALRDKYAIVTQQERVKAKWKALEDVYRLTGRCPSTKTPEGNALVIFEAAMRVTNPERVEAMRKKYGVKTRFDIMKEKAKKRGWPPPNPGGRRPDRKR